VHHDRLQQSTTELEPLYATTAYRPTFSFNQRRKNVQVKILDNVTNIKTFCKGWIKNVLKFLLTSIWYSERKNIINTSHF